MRTRGRRRSFRCRGFRCSSSSRTGPKRGGSSARCRGRRSRPRSRGSWDRNRVAFYPRPTDRPRSELELFTRKVLILMALLAAAALLWFARDVLLLVFIAAVLAAGIAPAVRRVRLFWRYRFRRKLSRGAAVMIVYLPFLIAVLLIGILVVPRFIADTRELGRQLPTLIDRNILTPLERWVPVGVV